MINDKIEYIVDLNVPEHILDKKTLFKCYQARKSLAIICPSWAAQDLKTMNDNVEYPNIPGWFPYTLNQDGNPQTIYIHSAFKERFRADDVGALRDIGAFPTTAGAFFYSQRFNIRNHANYDIINPELEKGLLREDFKGKENTDYFVHVDLATTNDSTGICLSHCNGSFQKDSKFLPKIVIDLIYEMNPKDYGGEIMLHNVRKFICQLRDKHRFNITDISFDSWQSKDSQQVLAMDGFRTHQISCDRTPYPHQALKEAINLVDKDNDFYPIEYYGHEKFMTELEQLVFSKRGVPDHPPSGCFTGSTRIKLLDGRNRTFIELVEEYSNHTPFYVYSIDRNNNVTIGKAYNARKTIEDAKLVKITLSNNKTIECTPEHRFMLQDGTYSEAQYLTIETQLMSLAIHNIKNVEFITKTEDVYDISVESHSNFALECGVFVHNSKDLADAVSGNLFNTYKIMEERLNTFTIFEEYEF